jgi:23S rRNA-/tRNA-specific pseudouridylate synthase
VRPIVTCGPSATLVEAFPASGRTHQVRVHLARAGHPLLVDPDYGDPGPWTAPGGGARLDRTPLHAASLELLHPSSGIPLRIEAPLPVDIAGAVAALRAP